MSELKKDIKRFWEKASLWSDKNEMQNAKLKIDQATKELKHWKKEYKKLPKGKRIKSVAQRREEAHSQSQTFKSPFGGLFNRRERLETIIARLENELSMAQAQYEGAKERRDHARKELKKLM